MQLHIISILIHQGSRVNLINSVTSGLASIMRCKIKLIETGRINPANLVKAKFSYFMSPTNPLFYRLKNQNKLLEMSKV